jgi:hypothetical protein
LLIKVESWSGDVRDPTAPQDLYGGLEAKYPGYVVVDYVIKAGSNNYDSLGNNISGSEPGWWSLTQVDGTVKLSDLTEAGAQVQAAVEVEPDAEMEGQQVADAESEASPGTLLATEGDDVFAFTLADAGSQPTTILGFGDSGKDVLDLRDLLQGEEAGGADLTSYLNVTYDGANTVIKVSADGDFKGNPGDANKVDHTITLEGVDLVSGHDDMASVIQSMLDSGKLSIDQ